MYGERRGKMNWDNLREIGVWFGMVVVLVLGMALLVVLIAVAVSPLLCIECNAKTADIGLEHRWGFWKGCQIEVEEGRWIPYERWLYGEFH